jgi:type IX secretion system PorP/SprF family membrane protein
MKRQILSSIIFVLFLSVTTNAQDIIYSQFYAAPLQMNPAFAGNTLAPRVGVNYRNQWPSLKAYSTYSVSYSQFLEDLNSGIGLMLTTDDAGDGLYKTNRFAVSYAYKLKVNRDFNLKLGLEAGLMQTNVDWNSLIFLDQIDPINGPIDPGGSPFPTEEVAPLDFNRSYFDAAAGILAYGPVFYGGISLKHLSTPDDGILNINTNLYNGLPMRISVHGGAQIPLGHRNVRDKKAFVSPNVLFIRQGDFGQVNGGAYFGLGMFFAGVWYRHAFGNQDAVISLVGVKKDLLKIGYSYDATISSLSAVNPGGTHEVSVRV